MHLPLGYKGVNSSFVCKLNKSIYGLNQASREWFTKLDSSVLAAGYKQSLLDHSLFTLKSGSTFVVVVVYVDDS